VSELLEHARRVSVRTVNRLLTATYWTIGRHLVEYEQAGKVRAQYGDALLKRLSHDLTAAHGRGFSRQNLQLMRAFYMQWEICQTPSGKFESWAKQAISAPARDELTKLSTLPNLQSLVEAFPLPWSHYVRLLSVDNLNARSFYEIEAMRGGWSERQL